MHSLVDKDPRVARLYKFFLSYFVQLMVLMIDLLHPPSINSQIYRYQVCKFAFVDLAVYRVGEKEVLIYTLDLNS